MQRVSFGSQPATSFVLTVPDAAESIASFSFVGDTADGASGGFRNTRAILSADLTKIFSDFSAGAAAGLLMISDRISDKIPVIPGEKLLVAMEDAGSGVIWFNTAE